MSNKKITRKGAGRTVGSFSFVKVPLADLVAKFNDTKTDIVIGRKWAEAVGIKAVSQPATEITNSIEGKVAGTEVVVTAVEL